MLDSKKTAFHAIAIARKGADRPANAVPRCFEEVVRNLPDEFALCLLDDIIAFETTNVVSDRISEMLTRAACFAEGERLEAKFAHC